MLVRRWRTLLKINNNKNNNNSKCIGNRPRQFKNFQQIKIPNEPGHALHKNGEHVTVSKQTFKKIEKFKA
jgi:hypothetical protein